MKKKLLKRAFVALIFAVLSTVWMILQPYSVMPLISSILFLFISTVLIALYEGHENETK